MRDIVRYLGIDTRAQLLAERLWQYLDEPSSGIIAAFLRHTRQSAVGGLLDDPIIERLMAEQKEHWCSLFNSGFDEAYQRRATLIGIRHRELGLDSKWYIAAHASIKARFAEELLLRTKFPLPLKSALLVTLEKYAAVDLAIVLSSYSSWLAD
ncbi:protoglobin domain-containing protein [Bradyrhizobium sp. BR13661]|uniref:protoglobin domain-containing protein n=2 Tax=Pseudomonadota TaxID=1224 RepID=UPI0024756BFC|nr:protoglobin domain-containing protein [Bradyrhizobium sp. BR13661]MDH6260430.1 hypothetical protein [Bradyrhizobium sp. BR13661]